MDPHLPKKESSQLDIICYDRINYPVIFDINEIVVVAPESVKGIIEVKSTLTKDSIKQILSLSESKPLKSVDYNSKIYLIAVKSSITPTAAFEFIKKYYTTASKGNKNKGKAGFNKFLGGIISLDWPEMLSFHLDFDDDNITYECLRSDTHGVGIGNFLAYLLHDLCGGDSLKSIINVLSPSISILKDSFNIKLHFKDN